MESNFDDTAPAAPAERTPSKSSATQQLHQQDEVKARMRELGPSRKAIWLELWDGLLIATYIAIFLFSAYEGSQTGGVATSISLPGLALLFVPLMTHSALASGARERFRIRTKPTPKIWIPIVVAFAGFIALMVMSIAEIHYPWWLNALVPTVILLAFSTRPAIRLARTPRDANNTTATTTRLSQPVRWNTVIIGALAGLIVATSAIPLASALAMMVASIGILVSLALTQSPWGLARTGYEWGSTQWGAFGIVVVTLFVLALLIPLSGLPSTPINVGIALALCAVMSIAATRPTRIPEHA